MKMSEDSKKIYNLPEEEFKHLCKNSVSVREIIDKLHLSDKYHSCIRIIRDRCKDLSITYPKWGREKYVPIYKVLINPCPLSPEALKRRIIREGCLSYLCKECGGSPIYNGKTLNLELYFINGVEKDARITNLKFLCPNCISQITNRKLKRGCPREPQMLPGVLDTSIEKP